MKKSLLNQQSVDEMTARVKMLNANSINRWGTMNATEMLLHCTLADMFILEDETPYKKQTFKQKLLTFASMNIIARFPKNRIGPKRIDVKGKIRDKHFEEQKTQLIATLQRFPSHGKPFTSSHLVMGSLKTEQWGVIGWMHMDHHLRQFGV